MDSYMHVPIAFEMLITVVTPERGMDEYETG
jgi:hypothetical protein